MLFLRTLFLASVLLISSLNNAAGYVEKDHYLYPIMIDIRYKRYDEAMVKLEPYAKQGDAQALFWYGYMKQSNWGRDRFAAYRWYEKSIEGGNPYSMFKLSGEDGTDYVCDVNGWECAEDNLDKAIQRWGELAEQGDVRAEYYLRYYDRSFLQIGYDAWLSDDNERAIIKAAKKGYYRPLARSTGIAYRAKKSYRERWGDEMYQVLLDNIDKDPEIAMHFVYEPYEGMTDLERRNILLNSFKKGYQVSGFSLFIENNLISKEEAYIISGAQLLGTEEEYDKKFHAEMFDVPEKKISYLDKRSEEFFNSIEHVVNFDEMEFMYFSQPDV
ncbi:hypothetical protein [Aliamphritea ceti]|uniref:hypothetical protein n=1 Tax=Aliamphritea ceti TaxID=1524258 RepID=UPI0021C3B2C4|nr:hypothetical protein [Aliamphritea ceti]